MTSQFLRACGVAIGIACVASHSAQQVADTAFAPPIAQPAFAADKGPLVVIDEAHHNFHTSTGRYQPFAQSVAARRLPRSGVVAPFTADALARCAHPRHRQCPPRAQPRGLDAADAVGVHAPTRSPPSATWVAGGGALLLIADHMPMAGAAEALGAAFGVTWHNGFAMIQGAPGSVRVHA